MILLAELATVAGIASSLIGFLSWYRAGVIRGSKNDRNFDFIEDKINKLEIQLSANQALLSSLINDLVEHDYKMSASCERLSLILQMSRIPPHPPAAPPTNDP